jgi:hypothetical protein
MDQQFTDAATRRVSSMGRVRVRVPGVQFGRVRAVAIALGTALAIALTPAGATTVAGPPTHPPFPTASGNFGVFSLIDNPTFAGAICYWHSGSHPSLYKITVRRPIVFASSRVSGTTSQKVGWRYQVEYSSDATNWSVIATSPIVKSTATRQREAFWLPRTFTFNTVPTDGYYRIKVRLLWYWPNTSTVDGTGTAYPQYYDVAEPFQQFLYNDCPQPLV